MGSVAEVEALLQPLKEALLRAFIADELGHCRLVNDLCAVGLLCKLFKGLHQSICDCHPWEALFAAVCTWHGVTTKTGQKRQVKLKLVTEPINARARLIAEDLRN